MSAVVTREKLHELINELPDERIQEVYEILEDAGGHYSDEFKAALDAEYEDYLNGRGEFFDKEEVDREIKELLYGNN